VSDFLSHRLHAIVDVTVAATVGLKPLDLARAFLDGGARVLQLRAKELPSGPLLELSDALVSMASEYTAGIIVNDRVDVALLARAHGVHVGQDDLAPAAARDQLGPAAIIGYSTHSVRQVEAALQDPVSYIAVGPVFGTATKNTGYSAVGLGLVSAATRLVRPIPVVAIGGVRLDNARSVIDAGASAVAVIADLLTDDPAARVRAYLQILE